MADSGEEIVCPRQAERRSRDDAEAPHCGSDEQNRERPIVAGRLPLEESRPEAPGKGCTVYAPVPKPKDPKVDRHAPKPGDSPAVAAWRARMATEEAKAIYKERAAAAECVNAQARNRGLYRLLVRGLLKVKAVALWYALAHNLMRAVSLHAEAIGTA